MPSQRCLLTFVLGLFFAVTATCICLDMGTVVDGTANDNAVSLVELDSAGGDEANAIPARIVNGCCKRCWVRDVHLGKVVQGDRAACLLGIYNSTDSVIRITDVVRSCECQWLSLKEGDLIPSGESIQFGYEAPTSQSGLHRASLKVITDAAVPELREIDFQICVDVAPLVAASPEIVQFGRVLAGGEKTQWIRLTSIKPNVLNGIGSPVAMHGHVSCALENRSATETVVAVTVPSAAPVGRLVDFVVLTFVDGEQESIMVTVPILAHIVARDGE